MSENRISHLLRWIDKEINVTFDRCFNNYRSYDNRMQTINHEKTCQSFLVIPCLERVEDDDVYKEALEMIIDPFFEELKRFGVHSWPRCTKPFVPILIPDRNNSLYDSVSVFICGFPEKMSAFQNSFINTCRHQSYIGSPLYIRWCTYMKREHQRHGIYSNDEFLQDQWKTMISSCIETYGREFETCYFLQFQLFVLAHVCRRIIIVTGLPTRYIHSSVYVPVLLPEKDCMKIPIYLVHHCGRFAPLALIDECGEESLVLDECIPLTDSKLNLFEFPFLFPEENGLLMVDKYSRKTTIVYTTSTSIVEVPSVRLSSRNLIHNMEHSRRKGILDICFSSLKIFRNASVVYKLWMHASEKEELDLQHLEPAPESGLTNLENSLETLRTLRNSPRTVGSSNSFQLTTSDINSDRDIISDFQSLRSLGSSDDRMEHTDSSYVSRLREDSNSARAKANVYSELSVNHDEATLTSSDQVIANGRRTSVDALSDDMDENIMLDRVGEIFDSPSHSSTNDRSNSDLEQTHSNRGYEGSSSAIVIYYSPSHLAIRNPESNLPKLKLELEQIEVTLKLTRHLSSNSLQLLIQKPSSVQLHCEHVARDQLMEMKLMKTTNTRYTIHMKLSISVIIPDEYALNDVSSLWADENDQESLLATVSDHPKKCRTAGCLGIGNRQKWNLCYSCCKSWETFSEKYLQSDVSFSAQFNSNSSIESNDVSRGKCKLKQCRNQADPQCYSLCRECFHKPLN